MDNHPQLYLFHSPLLVAKGSVVADCSRNKLPHPLFQNTEIDSKNAPSPLRASASLSSQCFTEFCPIMSVTYFTAMNGVFLVRHTHAWHKPPYPPHRLLHPTVPSGKYHPYCTLLLAANAGNILLRQQCRRVYLAFHIKPFQPLHITVYKMAAYKNIPT